MRHLPERVQTSSGEISRQTGEGQAWVTERTKLSVLTDKNHFQIDADQSVEKVAEAIHAEFW